MCGKRLLILEFAWHLYLGSLARNNGRVSSNVELLVIGTISLRQLGKLLSGAETKVGREINALFSSHKSAWER